MINIAIILKKVPNKTILYSPVLGMVLFDHVNEHNEIIVRTTYNGRCVLFNEFGQCKIIEKMPNCWSDECMLFPSKDIRDWNSFTTLLEEKPPFKPFDKVLVRDEDSQIWQIDYFNYFHKDRNCPYRCMVNNWKQCLPYNEETAKLIGTSNDYTSNTN